MVNGNISQVGCWVGSRDPHILVMRSLRNIWCYYTLTVARVIAPTLFGTEYLELLWDIFCSTGTKLVNPTYNNPKRCTSWAA